MRSEIRRLLREETAGTSGWSNELLLDLFNQSMDLRVMQLADAHEGWVTDVYTADLVANQREYQIPEGAGRIKRVLIVETVGSATMETPLKRDERWGTPLYTGASTSSLGSGTVPTYRLVGDLIFLEPAPAEARTGGLKIELESAPARIVNDSDKLDRAFPDEMETLLINDTVMLAFAVEDSQGYEGEMPDGYLRLLANIRKEFEKHFYQYIEQRSFGRVFSEPLRLGD